MNASGRCARRRSKTTHSSLLPSSMRRTCPRSRGILVQLEWSQQSLKLLSPTFWQWLPVSTGGSSQAKPEKYFYFLSISWRSHIIPPTPDTQAELDLDTRYIFFSSCKHIHTHIRFTRDGDGRPIILGDYKFEDEPNGRVVLFGR